MSAKEWKSELNAPFSQARATLRLDRGAPFTEVKAAYRRLVAAHPPDRDPAKFAEIRAAYELLSDPWKSARDRLASRTPMVEPFELPEIPKPGVLTRKALEEAIALLPAEMIASFDDE